MPDAAYVYDWVDSTSELQNVGTSDTDKSLAARLYAGCIIILRGVCSRISDPIASRSFLKPWVLRQELGWLYLWGEGLGNGKLNKALGDADELRESVIEVLVSIGMLLVRSKFIFLNPQSLSRHLAFPCDHCVSRVAGVDCILLLCSLLMAGSTTTWYQKR